MGMLGLLVPFLLIAFTYKPIGKMLGAMRKSGWMNMSLSMLAIAAFVVYGGSKPPPTPEDTCSTEAR